MLQVNDTMRLLAGLGNIGQQLCQDCLRAASDSLGDPEGGLERAYREQLRATRSAVDEVLSLEHRCVEAWRRQLPEGEALWSAPRAMLAVTDATIDSRAGLWHAWFASAERVDPNGLMTPLASAPGMFLWAAPQTPQASGAPPRQGKAAAPGPDAAADATPEGNAAR